MNDGFGHGHRRSFRIPGYDYTQAGAYFVTIVARDRRCLFGAVADGKMQLSAMGRIVLDQWVQTAEIRPSLRLTSEEFVVMPNHVHGIVWIDHEAADGGRRIERFGKPVPGSLPTILRAFKAAATKRVNLWRGTPAAPVWQRNYYEQVIRNEAALNEMRQYILDNPARWEEDRENPTWIEKERHRLKRSR